MVRFNAWTCTGISEGSAQAAVCSLYCASRSNVFNVSIHRPDSAEDDAFAQMLERGDNSSVVLNLVSRVFSILHFEGALEMFVV